MCKHDSARYRELSLFISSGKTDSSETMNSQFGAGGQVGSPRDMLDFVHPILKSRVLK